MTPGEPQRRVGAPRYPVMLDLAGRPCLVIGGGAVATRKVRGLLEAGATVTVAAPLLSEELSDGASRGEVAWIDRLVRADDALLDGRWVLVIAASDDAALNQAVARRCERSGTWVLDVSSASGAMFSTPAVHRQGPVTVAVATSGISPGAAAWLRDELAAAVDPAVVVVLDLLGELEAEHAAEMEAEHEVELAAETDPERGAGGDRDVVVGGHTGSAPGRFDWQRVLDSGTLDDIRHGRRARAKERLKACLSSSSD